MRRIKVPYHLGSIGLFVDTLPLALFCTIDDFGLGTLIKADFVESNVVLEFDYEGVLSDESFINVVEASIENQAHRCRLDAMSDDYLPYKVDGLNLIAKGMGE